jgi:hypothetical protein
MSSSQTARDGDSRDGGDRRSANEANDPLARVFAFSEWVLRNMMTPKHVLLHAAIIAPLQFRVVPKFIDAVALAQRAAAASGAAPAPPPGPLLPDFRFLGVSADALDATFAAYGPQGREAYANLLRVDVLYAAAYALFFGDVQGVAANLAGVRRGPWRAAHLLPWAAASLDVAEDVFLGAALHGFDAKAGRVAPGLYRELVSLLASAAIQAKWLGLAVCLVVLALTLMRGIVRLGLFLGHYVCGRKRHGGGGGGGGPRRRGPGGGGGGRRGGGRRDGGDDDQGRGGGGGGGRRYRDD